MIGLDDAEELRAGDPGRMLDAVASLPQHCRQGYAFGLRTAGLPTGDGITAVTFCGMGGSAVAGDVLRTLYRDRLIVPVDVNRSPELPAYCGPHTLVVCSSYSGETAETLACFRRALERGSRVIAVTSGGTLERLATEAGLGVVKVPGGFPPRAAFGYIAFAVLGAIETTGLLPSLAADLEETTSELDELVGRLGPDVPRENNPAKELAWVVGDRMPVIWGAEGFAAVAAARWKTQFNENAKVPAWSSSLPELDHNEVVGWRSPTAESAFVIALRHEGEHPDVAVRFPVSLDIAREAGAVTDEVWGAGRTSMARLLSLVLMGDYSTVYHALAHGVDPTPILAIDRLKAALAEA